MNILDAIKYWLTAHGYDGLCNPDQECGCPLDDLVTCGEPSFNECTPAHFRRRIDSCFCTAETIPGNHCLCTRRLEWWEGQYAHDPIDFFKV